MLADHCGHLRANARTVSANQTAAKAESHCTTLLRYFSGRMIASYVNQDSYDFKNFFVKLRREHYESKGQDPDNEEPQHHATEMLATLRAAMNGYPGRHSKFWCVQIHVPWEKRRKRRRWLRKQEVVRLLLACLGFMWDRKNRCWMTKQVVMPDGVCRTTRRVNGPETATMRQGISRLIRFILRTGMRHEAALMMKWGRWDDIGGVEFNGEDGMDWVHRRGRDEYNTNKSLASTLVYEELGVLLRIWAKQDGYIDADGNVKSKGDKPFIIRDGEDKAYDGYALAEFKLVCDWAGLDDLTIHPLKHTAATWCRQKGFSLESTSYMLDTSVETLRKFYTHVSKANGHVARLEFDDRPKRQAWRKMVHNDPDPSDPKRKRDKPISEAKKKKKAQALLRDW